MEKHRVVVHRVSTNYTLVLEVYFTLAYYFCCVPYRFRKEANDKSDDVRKYNRFITHKWWPQTLLYYLSSAIFVLVIWQDSIEQICPYYCRIVPAPAEQEPDDDKQLERNNPLLYLNIILKIAVQKCSLVFVYEHGFKSEKILAYLNKVQRYSQKYFLETSEMKPNCQQVKILYSSNFLYFVGMVITLLSLANFPMLLEPKTITAHFQNLNQFVRLATNCIRELRDLYLEFYFVVGIIPLWLISVDFLGISRANSKENQRNDPDHDQEVKRISTIKIIKIYKTVGQLSQQFARGYGYSLLCYLLTSILFYSINLGTIFQPAPTLGGKFYYIQYVCTFSTICGLGTSFAYKMSTVKPIINSHFTSGKQPQSQNACILMTHLCTNDFCAIRAKVFPVTFSTLGQFFIQIMVIFLICVQSKLSAV